MHASRATAASLELARGWAFLVWPRGVPRDARRWLDAAWLAALIGPLALLTRTQWGGVILVSLTSIALARIGVLRTKARERSSQ